MINTGGRTTGKNRRHFAVSASSSSSSSAGGKRGGDENLYEILNLSPPYESLTKKDIKSAFRKRALETHPDRNKAPNATEEFNKCKQAYNTLSDDRLREEYDRKRLFWKKNGAGGGGWAGASSSSYAARPKQQQQQNAEEQPFYGFSDFFRDVEKEFAERERRKGRDPSKPKSIWEELEMLGEEFVEFLEENERRDFRKYEEEANEKTSSTRTSNASSSSSSNYSSRSSSSSKTTTTTTTNSANKKAKDETVEEMLQALKKQMGKE